MSKIPYGNYLTDEECVLLVREPEREASLRSLAFEKFLDAFYERTPAKELMRVSLRKALAALLERTSAASAVNFTDTIDFEGEKVIIKVQVIRDDSADKNLPKEGAHVLD